MHGRLQLGAPGIYDLPQVPLRALTGVRMDVCAFAGVAPRGPAQVPYFRAPWAEPPPSSGRSKQRSVAIPVESWTDYERLFGSYEGPGLLPYAVASFFENGGRRAFIVRIVHDYGAVDPHPGRRVARAKLGSLTLSSGRAIALRASNEGSWGNALRAELRFSTRPLSFDEAAASLTDLVLPLSAGVPAGTLLRLGLAGGATSMRYVASLTEEWTPQDGLRTLRLRFDAPLAALPVRAEIVEGKLTTALGDRVESLEPIAFSSDHPRWLARVLVEESELLLPEERETHSWLEGSIDVAPDLAPAIAELFEGGEDRYHEIVHADFFDPRWTFGDEAPGDGVHALVEQPEIALLCVPDLYSPGALVEREDIVVTSVASGDFEDCREIEIEQQAESIGDLDGLRLDPSADLDQIIQLQRRLVELTALLRGPIVLLDVPLGLSHRKTLRWRAQIGDGEFAAAYFPWLDVNVPSDRRNALIRIPPSSVAAGIIAKREIEAGVQHGPANVIARGVVRLAERISPARHDELHPEGINVFQSERDGARLTGARTLARDPSYRQLSVRRLITMLVRVLERQMQWMVFEPNTRALRADVEQVLVSYLRQLFRANAFRGEREDQAFFVRCNDELNPSYVVDRGQLVAHIGVAPAEPIEFIVLELLRDGDNTLRIGGA
jgi:hypothetical protein